MQETFLLDIDWFFVVGKSEKIEDKSDIFQVDIPEKYSNIAYKTLTSLAYLKANLGPKKWVIKMDDDLNFRLDAILSQLKASQKLNDLHCPAILLNMPNALPKGQFSNVNVATAADFL